MKGSCSMSIREGHERTVHRWKIVFEGSELNL